MPSQPPNSPFDPWQTLWPGLLLAVGIVAVLASTPAVDQSLDSLGYLTKARDGAGLFHPHHLVFNAAVRLVYLGLDALVGIHDVVLAARIHNLFFTLVALLAVYWIGAWWLRSRVSGVLALALYGGSAGLAVFSTQAEVYIPAVASLGWTAVFFLYLVEAPESKWARAGTVATWVIAVLYHQTAVLFLIPMAATVAAIGDRRLGKVLMAVSGVAGAIVLGAYLLAYRSVAFVAGEPQSFFGWVFHYAAGASGRWGELSNIGASGTVRLLKSHFWGLSALTPESTVGLVALAALGVASGAAVWPVADTRTRLLLVLSATWALAFLGFFLWWYPVEIEFAVLTSMPLCLALASGVHAVLHWERVGDSWGRVVIAAVIVVAAINFWATMRFEVRPRHSDPGLAYHRAQFLAGFDDVGTLRLARTRVAKSMVFYFGATSDSVARVNVLERALYRGKLDRAWMTRSRWDRVVVNIADIEPRARYDGRDGFSEPETWLRLIHWVFNLRQDGDELRSDGWKIVTDDRGDQYVLVSAADRSHRDSRQLLETLVADLGSTTTARRTISQWIGEKSP